MKSKDLLAKRSTLGSAGKPNGAHPEENLPPLKFLISASNGTITEILKEPNLSVNIPPLEAIAKRERASETKNGRLRTGKSFKFCIDLLEATGAKQPDKKDKSNLTVLQEIKGSSSSGFEEARPIIVVPNAPHQGNLSLFNAVDFLKNGTYRSPELISKKAEEKLNDTKVTFTTQINEEDVTFEVTNDPSMLKASNKLYASLTSDHVVAIFLLANSPHQFRTAEKIYGEGNIAKLLKRCSRS